MFRFRVSYGLCAALLCAGLVSAALPAVATTHCVPAGNPGACDDFHATIQDAIDDSVAGDTVLVGPGTYAESPLIHTSITLTSNAGRDATTIELQRMTNYVHSITILGGLDVLVEGFTVVGLDSDCALPAGQNLAASNFFLNSGVGTVTLAENRIRVGFSSCSNGDDGMGFITTYSPAAPAGSLTVRDNIFEPLTAAGGVRAFYVNPGLVDFVFERNLVSGTFFGTAITQAQNGLVVENLVNGDTAGLGTWGFPDANVWGHTVFMSNVFTNLIRGVGVFETNNVHFECNLFQANQDGIGILDGYGTPNFDPTTISMLYNRLKFNTVSGATNAAVTPGLVNGEDNFWGTGGPSGDGPGSGDAVFGMIDVDPWLTQSPVDLCDPLAIKLDSLRAVWTEAGVEIRWTTLLEENSVGFRILRAAGTRKADIMETITPQPILPQGNALAGADYTFVDASASGRQVVRYYLEEIDVNGEVTRYGPVSPEPRERPAGRRAAR